ncbi:MAG: leucine-rich repeat protein, partial [Holosporales bacterium]
MTFSRITRTLGLVTLLGSSLSDLQATELMGFADLPEDALLGIMHFLPDRDIGAMAMTSRAPSEVSRTALFSMISEMTLNRGTGEGHKRLQDLPTSRVQRILGQIVEQDQYLAIPMNSPLCSMIPDSVKLADLEDWRRNLAVAMPLYKAAFGKELPEDHVNLALQHLLAVINTRVYVQPNNVNQSFKQFAEYKSKSLIESLQNQRKARPFVNLLHGDVDEALLATQAHIIVLSDAELCQPETKQKLEKLLGTQTADHTHHVMLSVGNTPARLEDGILTLRTDDLPSNVRHLTVTNPTAHVTTIGSDFLKRQEKLLSLKLVGFRNVSKVKENFLYECTGLTHLDLSDLKNVNEIGSAFLIFCRGLTSVDLSAFTNVTQIGAGFLGGCTSLTSVDLSAFTNVTQIEGSFLSGCTSLTSVDLSPFKKVTKIGDLFLHFCSGLTSVDLSVFNNVTQIDRGFIVRCYSLTH